MNDATVQADNPLRFRKDITEPLLKYDTIEKYKTLDKQSQSKWSLIWKTKTAKISALYSCKIDKYEYLTGHDLQPPAIKNLIEPKQYDYSP